MSDISFSKLTWENLPARTTALSATNLNRIEKGIDDSVNGVNSNSHSIAELQTRISQMSGGAPPTASSTSGMNPEVSTVYINTTDGNWYYWDGSAWQIGGVYGGAVTDTILSVSGAPADAKAVGDALAEKADADDLDAVGDDVTSIYNGLIDGFVPIKGTLVTGFYPVATGAMGSSANAKTMVYPVAEGETYFVTWKTTANKYRTAFGNVAPNDISAATATYDYVDNASTSHINYQRKNTGGYSYLYVYIGNQSATNDKSAEVAIEILHDVKACFASENETW